MIKEVHFGGYIEEEENEPPSGFVFSVKVFFANLFVFYKFICFRRKKAKRNLEADLSAVNQKSASKSRRTPKSATLPKKTYSERVGR